MPRHAHSTRHPAARPAYVPPLPHPSWRPLDAATGAAADRIDPREFWQRLGL